MLSPLRPRVIPDRVCPASTSCNDLSICLNKLGLYLSKSCVKSFDSELLAILITTSKVSLKILFIPRPRPSNSPLATFWTPLPRLYIDDSTKLAPPSKPIRITPVATLRTVVANCVTINALRSLSSLIIRSWALPKKLTSELALPNFSSYNFLISGSALRKPFKYLPIGLLAFNVLPASLAVVIVISANCFCVNPARAIAPSRKSWSTMSIPSLVRLANTSAIACDAFFLFFLSFIRYGFKNSLAFKSPSFWPICFNTSKVTWATRFCISGCKLTWVKSDLGSSGSSVSSFCLPAPTDCSQSNSVIGSYASSAASSTSLPSLISCSFLAAFIFWTSLSLASCCNLTDLVAALLAVAPAVIAPAAPKPNPNPPISKPVLMFSSSVASSVSRISFA